MKHILSIVSRLLVHTVGAAEIPNIIIVEYMNYSGIHAPDEEIVQYLGKYSIGWDKIRGQCASGPVGVESFRSLKARNVNCHLTGFS